MKLLHYFPGIRTTVQNSHDLMRIHEKIICADGHDTYQSHDLG